MYRLISTVSNYFLGVGGLCAIAFGIGGLVSIYLGSSTDIVALINDTPVTILASR